MQQDNEIKFEWDDDESKAAICVPDDAMLGDHIVTGDYVVIRRAGNAEDGQIVAFRDYDGVIKLRRIRFLSGTVRLVSSRPEDYPDIRCEHPAVVGIVVGVVRKY